MKLLRSVTCLLVSALVLINVGQQAFAQNNDQSANGFRVSPVRSDIIIEKGTSKTVTITVENPSSLPIKASALINDFIPSKDEDGQPRILLDNSFAPSHSLKKLISNIPDTDIAANERKEIKITIATKADTKAGGYYGVIRFIPAANKKNSNVSLTASVGSIFLVNVPGAVKEHLDIVGFSAASKGEGKKILTSGKVSIITRIKNDGDTHEKPFGKIQVKNSKGKVVAAVEINDIEPQANILPDSTRKFETKLPDVKWFGRYTVTTSLGYNPSNGDLIEAKTSFWYLPVWLIILAGILLVALLLAAYVLYKKATHHKRARRS